MSLLSVVASASTSGVTYQGRILKPDGSPLSGQFTQFKMQIRTPDSGSCLMYEEVQSQDLRNSGGVFSLTINDGSGSRTDSTGLTLDRIFANRGSFALNAALCNAGPGTYAPGPNDGRDLVVLFKDETMATWEPIPAQKINFVPFAFEAKQVAGFTADSLLRVVDGSGDPLTGVSPLSNAQYTALLDLINGSSAQYTKAGQLNGVALPTMTTGEVLGWNGTTWVSQAATGGPNSITTTMIQNGAVDGTKLDPAISISTSGMIAAAVTTTRDFKIYAASPSNFYVGMLADPTLAASYTLTWPLNAGAANQVLTTDGSGKLTWTTPSSAGITDLTGDVTASGPGSAAATIANNAVTTSKIIDKAVTYAKIQDVTSGKLLGRSTAGAGAIEEISVGTGLAFSGGILSSTASDSFAALPCGDGYVPYKDAGSWTCKAVDAGNTSGAIVSRDSFGSFIASNAKLTSLSLDNAGSLVTLQNLSGSNYTLTLPATAGSGNQVLTTDGLGGLSWTTPSTDVGGSGTANFVPKFTATRTLGDSLIYDDGARVGIGTTSPGYKLDVAGDVNVTGNFKVNGVNIATGGGDFKADGTVAMTGALRSAVGTAALPGITFNGDTNTGLSAATADNLVFSTAGFERLKIDGNGVVTTPFLSSLGVGGTPTRKIEAFASAGGLYSSSSTSRESPGTANNGMRITVGNGIDNQGTFYEMNIRNFNNVYQNAYVGGISNPSGYAPTIVFGQQTGATAYDERMRIDTAGNVGIGTTSPNGKLDVNGSIVMSGATSGYTGFQPAATAGSTIWTLPSADGTSGQILSTDGAGVLSWTSAGGGGDFKADGSVAMTGVFKASNGTAAAPSMTFGSNTNTGMYRVASNKIGFSTNGSSRMVIDNTGVGIGKTSANAPLDVGGLINTDEGLLVGGYGALENTDDTLKINFTSGAFNVGIYPGSVGPAAIWVRNPTGEVGIGTTSPHAKFDVKGSIVMSGSTSGYTGFQPAAVAGSTVWTLPSADGTSGQVLKTDGSGTLSWISVSDTLSGLSCSGGQVSSWSGSAWVCASTSVSNSNNTLVLRDGSGNVGANVVTANGLSLSNGASSTITLTTPTAFSSYSLQLPATYGTSGQVLTSDGAGASSWTTVGTGDFKKDGSVQMTGSFSLSASQASPYAGSGSSFGPSTLGTFKNSASANNYGSFVTFSGQNGSSYPQAAYLGLVNQSGNGAAFAIGATTAVNAYQERLRIDANGSVGIGTTSPSSPLTVAGIIESTTGGIKFPDGTTQTTAASGGGSGDFKKDGSVAMTGVFKASNGTAAAPGIAFAASTGTGFSYNGGGLVYFSLGGSALWQFGTTEMGSVSIGGGHLSTGTTAAANGLTFNGDSGTGLYRPAASTLGVSTGGSERIRIDSIGNVGIGTTSPNQRLEVVAAAGYPSPLALDTSDFVALGTGSRLALGFGASFGNTFGQIQAYQNGVLATGPLVLNPNGGNVGIGTTAPGSKLSVAGTIESTTGGIKFPDGTTQTTAASGGGSGDFMKNGSVAMTGNLKLVDGLTTAPALTFASDTTTGLSYDGSRLYVSVLSGLVGFDSLGNVIADGGSVYTNAIKFNSSDTSYIGKVGANDIAVATSSTERMRITSAGFVGIGTTSPSVKLDVVSGDVRAYKASTSNTMVYAENTAGFVGFTMGNGFGNVGTGGANPLTFSVGGTEGARLTSAGYVGIGTTSPGYKLDVNGTANATQLCIAGDCKSAWPSSGSGDFKADGTVAMTGQFKAAAGSVTTPGISFATDTNTGFYSAIDDQIDMVAGGTQQGYFNTGNFIWFGDNWSQWFKGTGGSAATPSFRTTTAGDGAGMYGIATDVIGFSTASTERMRITAAGKVGIGTTSPSYPLHVKATSLAFAAESTTSYGIYGQTATGAAGIYGYSTGGTNGVYGTSNSGIGVEGGSATGVGGKFSSVSGYALITTTGNVGIGTTSPGYNLDVNGIANATQLCIAGDCKSSWPSGGGGLPAADGSAAAPTINFTNATTSGLYKTASGGVGITASGMSRATFDSGSIVIGTSGPGVSINSAAYSLTDSGLNMVSNPSSYIVMPSGSATAPSIRVLNGVTTPGLFSPSTNALAFTSGVSEKMRIDAVGNVGIGTTEPMGSPQFLSTNMGLLHVTGSGDFKYSSGALMLSNSRATTGNDDILGRVVFSEVNNGTNGSRVKAGIQSSSEGGTTGANGNGGNLQFQTKADNVSGAASERMRITGAGNVGIGTTSPTQTLEVNGTILASAYLYSSDRRLKKDITPLEQSLEKLLTLNTVKFNWITPHNSDEERTQIGLIAQDVQKVFPEAVKEDSQGWLRMNYQALISPIIDGLREMYQKLMNVDAKTEALQARVSDLEAKNKNLEERLSRLEKALDREPASSAK